MSKLGQQNKAARVTWRSTISYDWRGTLLPHVVVYIKIGNLFVASFARIARRPCAAVCRGAAINATPPVMPKRSPAPIAPRTYVPRVKRRCLRGILRSPIANLPTSPRSPGSGRRDLGATPFGRSRWWRREWQVGVRLRCGARQPLMLVVGLGRHRCFPWLCGSGVGNYIGLRACSHLR